MCAPAAIGIAQAGVGIAGAVGQQGAANAQYQAQKQQAEMQRRQMIVNRNHRDAQDVDRWEGELEIWRAKKSHYNEQLYESRDAAGRAFGAASMQEEKLYRDFVASSSNTLLQQLAAKTGAIGARGRTAQRMRAMPAAQAGRALATAKDNLKYGMENIDYQKNEVVEQWQNDNRQNWKQVSIAPRPTMRSSGATFLPGDPPKPSNVGMITGIASSLLGGMKAFNSLSPPGQGLFGGGGATPNIGALGIGQAATQFNPGILYGQQ